MRLVTLLRPAAFSPPHLPSAGALSSGLDGERSAEERRRQAHVCLGAASVALALLLLLALGWQLLLPFPPGPPDGKEERLVLFASHARAVRWIRLAERPEQLHLQEQGIFLKVTGQHVCASNLPWEATYHVHWDLSLRPPPWALTCETDTPTFLVLALVFVSNILQNTTALVNSQQ